MENSFGAVYYNFPHAGVVQGFFDGHPFVRWRHENLMHLFFRALRGFVKPGGIVKVASNSNATGEFLHVETLPLLEWSLRSYHRSYGDRRDSSRRPDEKVYAFRYEPSGSIPPKALIRRPPTKDDLFLSPKEGKMPMSAEQKRKRLEDETAPSATKLVIGDDVATPQHLWACVVFMPAGCPISVLQALLGRLALDSHCEARVDALWRPSSLAETLQLAQVASMLQIEEVMPELVNLVSEAMASGADAAELQAACERLQSESQLGVWCARALSRAE
ncbi:Ranbp2 [Symbiodinium natans]|uniref:Ranbp2 protein n=1 Tax=Symbiodinium natans TaxID=878477 RepID=A0A812I478_9DINO|nr:Ranbp2 [Symbiodinium natans]